ncbi:MAG: MarR family transcriptional regulator [Alphaproteobacteria bacterium]|nr:MarR family transcriptional regulator [Alphaproteobacteria bacterium]
MADAKAVSGPVSLKEEGLHQAIQLLFFAYRDFTARADAVLAKQGFGRAHHRVIYFVGQYPGINVSELLKTLGITKQSLSRVLSHLVRDGYIEQKRPPPPKDGRLRLLHLTDKGYALERDLTAEQRIRITAAFKDAGATAIDGFRRVMVGIMNEPARKRFRHQDK